MAFGGVMAMGVPASQAAPFDCTTGTIFLSQGPPTGGTQLNALEYGAGQTQFRPIGPPFMPSTYNALGFNPDDNFLYAIDIDPGGGPKSLFRIHDDGSVESFPLPGLEPLSQFHSGAFDDAGNYYVAQNGDPNNGLFQIDVATQAVTRIQLSGELLVSDFTFADGFLWGIATDASGALRRINPTTGQIDSFPQTAVPGPYLDPSTGFGLYGANWTYGNGNLGFSNNQTGQVTQVELSNPGGTPTLQRVSLASGPSSALNDGAMCPGLPTDLAVEKTGPAEVEPGGQVTWTITVTNNGPGGSSGFTVDDTIPAGVTNPQTSTAGCTISGGNLQCVLGMLANGDSTDITLTATMPSTHSTCVTNTASVIGNEEDPVAANNSDDAETCTPGQTPWACDGAAYTTAFGGEVGNQTEFARMDRQPDGTYTRTVLATGPAGEQLNGLGFRTQDGLQYAWNNQAQRIVRIGDNQDGTASIDQLPPVVGLPQFGAFVGTFLEDGTYFLFGTPTNPTGFIIDVSGPVPTVLSAVTPSFDASINGTPLGDIAVSPVDGNLYAVADGVVHRFTLTGSAPIMQLNLGPAVWDAFPGPGASPGAQWFEPGGAAGTLLYPNQGSLWSQDMATGAFTAVGSFPQIPNADGASCPNGIAVKKDASPRTVTAGGELTYGYTITARGLVDNPVDFVDTLPAGMTYVPGGVTVNGTFGPTNNYAGTNTLSISGTIPRNTTVTITARVRVAATAPCNVNVPNQAKATMRAAGLPDVTIVSDDPTTPTDPDDPTNVHVNCPPPPPPPPPSADVTIDKTVSAPRVRVGEMVTYRMVAKNNGPGVATNVKVDDTVPSRLDARSARSAQGKCSVSGNKVHCELGTMAVGQEIRIAVRARAIRSGRTTNTATVDSPQCTTHPCDRDPGRVIIVKPKLKLTKNVGKRVLRAGETTSYRIRVRNPSDVRLRRVRVCDRLPAGLVYVSAKPKPKVSKGKHCWRLKRLGAHKSKTYRVTVRALRGTSGRKVNTATATSPDAKRDRAKRAVRVIAGEQLPTAVTG